MIMIMIVGRFLVRHRCGMVWCDVVWCVIFIDGVVLMCRFGRNDDR